MNCRLVEKFFEEDFTKCLPLKTPQTTICNILLSLKVILAFISVITCGKNNILVNYRRTSTNKTNFFIDVSLCTYPFCYLLHSQNNKNFDWSPYTAWPRLQFYVLQLFPIYNSTYLRLLHDKIPKYCFLFQYKKTHTMQTYIQRNKLITRTLISDILL